MRGIRTGDWGAIYADGQAHCWVRAPRPGSGIVWWNTVCGARGEGGEPTLVPGNGETCDRCREIVERAARGVPQ